MFCRRGNSWEYGGNETILRKKDEEKRFLTKLKCLPPQIEGVPLFRKLNKKSGWEREFFMVLWQIL